MQHFISFTFRISGEFESNIGAETNNFQSKLPTNLANDISVHTHRKAQLLRISVNIFGGNVKLAIKAKRQPSNNSRKFDARTPSQPASDREQLNAHFSTHNVHTEIERQTTKSTPITV